MQHHDETARIRVRKRSQQHRLHDRKYRARRTDAEADREDGERREAELAAEDPKAVPDVASKCVHAGSTKCPGRRLAGLGRLPASRRRQARQPPRRYRPRRASTVALRSASDVAVVRSTSASLIASSHRADQLGAADRRAALGADVGRDAIEEDDLTVEEHDRDLGPGLVVDGRTAGAPLRAGGAAGGREDVTPRFGRWRRSSPARHRGTRLRASANS